MDAIVHASFEVPPPLTSPRFRFEPLAGHHNDVDLPAWTSSIEHIRASPGFAGRGWPAGPVSAQENLRDLLRHERHRQERSGFTYAVFSGDEYVGCVYFYPPRTPTHDVDVRSWVTQERADLDRPLYEAVSRWLRECWPWKQPDYAER
ncbi:hypothetical protein GCM10022223_51390 [Kineosporia mesophila]|uniref:N-acetyltransferase n=1 Tax=Kineosporia mesophila TaxID=566012 RepID=A0ABP7A9X1_9ACTN|nr:hypothetical protein [Kineosporia mesophila]MCD5354673.1 hypothetical protein [Kineosporia mesophila]